MTVHALSHGHSGALEAEGRRHPRAVIAQMVDHRAGQRGGQTASSGRYKPWWYVPASLLAVLCGLSWLGPVLAHGQASAPHQAPTEPLAAPGSAAQAAQAPKAARRPTILVAHAVEIRRTTDGVPHVLARDWRALGAGIGYVQAEDALCTLAEAFVTYEGRRAWFFGAEERPARASTFGQSKNLDLDFFFRGFADATVIQRYRAEHPPELRALVEGYAVGYNRYLSHLRADAAAQAHRPCARAEWLRDIRPEDVYRRMYAAQVAAGLTRFIPQIVNAAPPAAPLPEGGASAPAASVRAGEAALQAHLSHGVGDQPALGSNALAFGREATGENQSVLLGNPHWFWGGPDRFYQMHLTIPGKLNVAGAGFIGVPLVMIGFNNNVAWSHTVSAARRFGLFQLALDPSDPTRVLVDGQSEALQARLVEVEVREGGEVKRVRRTLYRSRFGPVLDLGNYSPAFRWTASTALAIRDANEDNFRAFRNFFFWNRAKSLDDFIAIQKREAGMPWVTTTAVGRGDGRVWFADIGAVPNVSDEQRRACATPLGAGFARLDATTPFLDGSRAACDWAKQEGDVRPGLMAATAMPQLLRQDYVANMNDSYWLTNASAPLEGYPSVLGGERKALSLRGRLGHQMAAELLQSHAGSAAALSRQLRQAALTPRAYSAERFKTELLEQACAQPVVEWVDAPSGKEGLQEGQAAPVPVRHRVDVSTACQVLERWSGQAEVHDMGAPLWDAFWDRLEAWPAGQLYRTPFSSDAPLTTPAAPGGERASDKQAQVARALAGAVEALGRRGQALDANPGDVRAVVSGKQRVPIYGGCHGVGYFVVLCNGDGGGDSGRPSSLGPDSFGNSYMQVVTFSSVGVQAWTLQAMGQDESALVGGQGLAPVQRYSRKDWLPFPFREQDITSDPRLKRLKLLF
ncbi:penicillin acylase family protein [Roseateles sp. SL47]|uniref:penicillin acylase family protein n=1 Tax=Roseateles sp. SL47 TaxID=2995138 RepID=UPI0022702026|nr:penicillin acylase family protein [Roseateles sp. SL47]WAC71649.1 penicillin acylase family protein [Roseateles sp. SL47]